MAASQASIAIDNAYTAPSKIEPERIPGQNGSARQQAPGLGRLGALFLDLGLGQLHFRPDHFLNIRNYVLKNTCDRLVIVPRNIHDAPQSFPRKARPTRKPSAAAIRMDCAPGPVSFEYVRHYIRSARTIQSRVALIVAEKVPQAAGSSLA